MRGQAANATGREMVIECCNTGGCVGPRPVKTGATPLEPDFCPFNMFRTGIDIAPSPLSTVSNLLDTARFLNASRPGCWAVRRSHSHTLAASPAHTPHT